MHGFNFPAESFPQADPLLTSSFDPTTYFGSEAANLEYSILSAILGNPSPPDSSTTPPPVQPEQQFTSWPQDTISFSSPPLANAANISLTSPYGENQIQIQQSESNLSTSPNNPAHYLTYPYPQTQQTDALADLTYPPPTSQSDEPLHPLQPRYPLDTRPRSPPLSAFLPSPAKDSRESLSSAALTDILNLCVLICSRTYTAAFPWLEAAKYHRPCDGAV